MIEVFLKNTQTLIGSLISTTVSIIIRKKGECLVGVLLFLMFTTPAFAYDSLSVPNNKFGIHIISPTPDEASSAASLVNSTGGDWGYVTFIIEDKDRKKDKWQEFFNVLRRNHLIPIVRLATHPDGSNWIVPGPEQALDWADFLDSLNWPAKNKYVVIYNEPNQAQEWGGKVDATSYAKVLDTTITALKNKSPDFFVLNSGFDASAPQILPNYEDELNFLNEMNQAVPGIFNRLDGWSSHSYPNPAFSGSPAAAGRGTIRTFQWELSNLGNLGLAKNLPVFITETGWKHAEGLYYDKSLLSSDQVGNYLKQAFLEAWSDPNIVAVTPFVLNYQESSFDHFSFKQPAGSQTSFYPQFQAMASLNKPAGKPVQEDKAELLDSGIYKSIVSGESYTVHLTFKNIGQAIWGEDGSVKLVVLAGGKELGIQTDNLPQGARVEPGQKNTFYLKLKAPLSGQYRVVLALYNGSKQVQTRPLEFTTEVKSPVILIVKGKLMWKNNFSGNYLLSVASDVVSSAKSVLLGDQGISDEIEARDLLPDYGFDFTLSKPFYQPKTIRQKVSSGVNTLDFGELAPDFSSAILNPKELWKLLPFSN